ADAPLGEDNEPAQVSSRSHTLLTLCVECSMPLE
ncbi:hypothetical protein AK812_SmicGene48609, partial [Symbiodinium microadriaticum]